MKRGFADEHWKKRGKEEEELSTVFDRVLGKKDHHVRLEKRRERRR